MNKYTIFSICESERNVYPHPKNYESYAIRLARSIRKNGGKYKDVKIKMWYGEDAPPSKESMLRLTDMGCDLQAGHCLFTQHPVYNKVTACGMQFDTEYAMWMDSDLYVRGDLSEILETNKDVVVSPDQKAIHKWSRPDEDALWEQIYETLHLVKPEIKIPCHIDGGLGNFYFCSGIFMFKTGIGFPQLYQGCASAIIGLGGPFKENFTQTGLGMAVHAGNLSYDLIPEKYHYFYTLHDKKLSDDTVVVHYQDNRVTEISDEEWDV